MKRWRPPATRILHLSLAASVVGVIFAGSSSASVLVVGDSLAVGTDGALRAALPGVTIESDSLNGRPSAAGLPPLSELLRPEHDTVVFDLGTNDGNAAVATTASSLVAARELTGNRCLVVATLNRPPLAGIPIDAQNAMIRRFAATTPNVALVDWNDAASATPGALRDDGVHATAAGYALRGSLFSEAIRAGCLGGGSGATPPPTGGRQASTTDRPATARRRPRGGPPFEARLASTLRDRLAADGGPFDLAGRAGAVVAAAVTALGEVLTPRGPEPVLGAE